MTLLQPTEDGALPLSSIPSSSRSVCSYRRRVRQLTAHFGVKLYDACKHLDTEGVGTTTTGHLRKLFFGDYMAPEGAEVKARTAPTSIPPTVLTPILSKHVVSLSLRSGDYEGIKAQKLQ